MCSFLSNPLISGLILLSELLILDSMVCSTMMPYGELDLTNCYISYFMHFVGRSYERHPTLAQKSEMGFWANILILWRKSISKSKLCKIFRTEHRNVQWNIFSGKKRCSENIFAKNVIIFRSVILKIYFRYELLRTPPPPARYGRTFHLWPLLD